jgi:hypothetical protein
VLARRVAPPQASLNWFWRNADCLLRVFLASIIKVCSRGQRQRAGHAQPGHGATRARAWAWGSSPFRKGSNCLKIEAAAIACPAGSQ